MELTFIICVICALKQIPAGAGVYHCSITL